MSESPTFPTSQEFVKQLRDRHQSHLFGHAAKLCYDSGKGIYQAKDLVQDFYVKIIESHPFVYKKYQKSGLPYLLTMIKNAKFDHTRKAKKEREFRKNFRQKYSGSHYEMPHFREDRKKIVSYEQLRKVLKRELSPQKAELMVAYLAGTPQEEMAQEFNTNINTIGIRIHRIRKKLREKWESAEKAKDLFDQKNPAIPCLL